MFFVFCVFSLCDQYAQAKELKNGFQSIDDRADQIKKETNDLSEKLNLLNKKIELIGKSRAKSKSTADSIRKTGENMKESVPKKAEDSVNKYIIDHHSYRPVNISLVRMVSNVDYKNIDFLSTLKSKFIHYFRAPSIEKKGKEGLFWEVRGKSADFIFVADRLEKISRFEIATNLLKGTDKCGVKTFEVEFEEHHRTVYRTGKLELLEKTEKPQNFGLNNTIWFRVMRLTVHQNYGQNYICLPDVRVFDEGYYSK